MWSVCDCRALPAGNPTFAIARVPAVPGGLTWIANRTAERSRVMRAHPCQDEPHMCSGIGLGQHDPGAGAHIEAELDGDLLGGGDQGLECVLDRLGGIADMDECVIQCVSDLVDQSPGRGCPCASAMWDCRERSRLYVHRCFREVLEPQRSHDRLIAGPDGSQSTARTAAVIHPRP